MVQDIGFKICISTYIMKCLFCILLIICVLFSIFRLLNEIHILKTYDEMVPEPIVESFTLEEKTLFEGRNQDDRQLVEELKKTLLPPGKRGYHLRYPIPVKEHILERAIRELNHLAESGHTVRYLSKYHSKPELHCQDEKRHQLSLDYPQSVSFSELVVRCEEGLLSVNHRRVEFGEDVMCTDLRRDNLRRGYFVEVGAGDGEHRSPTICLETEDKWEGLLIEADARNVAAIDKKARKTWLSPTCVGLAPVSYMGKFGLREGFKSKLISEKWEDFSGFLELQCYPLYTHLLAVGRNRIDFMVININGKELEVLKTLPWERIYIKFLALPYRSMYEKTNLSDYIVGNGYLLYKVYHHKGEAFALFAKRAKEN